MESTELFFDGKKYTIKPSFKLIRKIESAINPKGLFEFAQDLSTGKFKITEIAEVTYCMVGNKVKMTPEEVGDVVMEDVTSYIVPIANFIMSMFKGSDEMPEPESTDEELEGNE